MSDPIVLVRAGDSQLVPAPIPASWVIAGTPRPSSKALARSRDRLATVYDWSCTAGTFRWRYAEDEVLVVVSGEVFITDDAAVERRLGPGDMGFFPAGSSATWRVPDHVRKFAMIRKALPAPIAFAIRAWRKLRSLMRAPAASPLTQAAAQ